MSHPSSARRPGLVLISLALAQLIIALDYSIVFVALPDIGSHVGFSAQELQWVIGAYAVAFGGFLLLGGRLSDLIGRRRLFLAGLSLYAVASIAGGLAQTPGLLVGARAVQGLAGAFLAPATLSLITTMFAEGPERNRALGVWGASGSSGMVLGSLLGGVLTQALGWEAVFFVNVPLAVVVGALALRVVPADPPSTRRQGFDLPGAFSVTAGALLFVFALVRGPESGWVDPLTIGSLVLAVLLIVTFVTVESRTKDPLVPLRVFSFRSLRYGSLITFSFMATFGASPYFLTLALQDVRGWDALQTGLAFILPCACVLVGTVIGGKLSTAIGVRAALVIALVVGAIGTAAWAPFLGQDASYLQMTPGIIIFSIAQGVVFTAMYAASAAGVEAKLQGLASGLATSGQQIGAAVGLAVLIAVSRLASHGSTAPGKVSDGLQLAVYVSAALILATILIALALPKQPAVEAAAAEAGKATVPEPAMDASEQTA